MKCTCSLALKSANALALRNGVNEIARIVTTVKSNADLRVLDTRLLESNL
jgi:hypothetical protein